MMTESRERSEDFQGLLNEENLIALALKEKMPYGYFYDVPYKNYKPDGSTRITKDYSKYARIEMLKNSSDFLKLLNKKSGTDLIEEFEVQLFYYRERIKNLPSLDKNNELLRWLNHTEKIINRTGSNDVFGEGNKYVKYEFHKWLNLKLKERESNQFCDKPDVKENEQFYFTSTEKLPQLYNNLLRHNPPLISENKFFMESLLNESVNP
ncbi:MAG: hypothetical protein H0X46_06895, partial [Bacteroidetes bacterium]|nr:hypothetical protein [Bacteroidota bacterium]